MDVLRHRPAATVVVTRGDTEVARWALGPCGWSDLATINHLARLQLAVGRVGYAISLRDACRELAGLIELAGLSETLLRQVRGEPEDLEQIGVEEVVVPDDPIL